MAFFSGFHRLAIGLSGLTIVASTSPAIATAPAVQPQPTPASTATTAPSNARSPHPADILPADAAGLILINAQPQRWIDLTRFGLFPPDFSAPSFIFELIAPRVQFSTDIQPWMGEEFAFGYLSNQSLGSANFVVIAPVKTPDRIPQFLKLVEQRQDKPVKLETYQGVEIRYWEPKEFKIIQDDTAKVANLPPAKPLKIPGWSIAYLPEGYVVAGENPTAIKQIIDNRNQSNFSSTKAFQQMQAHPHYDRALAIGGGDYRKFLPLLTKPPVGIDPKQTQSLPVPGLPNLPINPLALIQAIAALSDELDTFGGALWATPEGLRMQSSATLKNPLPQKPVAATQSQILSLVPANSYGVITAQGGVEGLAKSLSIDTGIPSQDGKSTLQNPAFSIFTGAFQKLSQRFLGIDGSDITPWLDGELALFAFPTQQGQLSQRFKVDMGLGAVIQTSDRDLANKTLSKLLRHLQEQNPQTFQSTKQTVKGTEVIGLDTVAQGQKPKNLFSYSWIKPDTVLIQSAIDPLLIPQPWQPLAQSPNFQVALKALPPSDLGYFYMNGSSTTALIFNSVIPNFVGASFAKNPFINQIRDIASSIRSVAGTTRTTNKDITNDGLILLNRNRQTRLNTWQDWLGAGEAQLTQRRPAWAVANYSQALRLSPNNPKILQARGQARVKSGDARGSIADFNAAIDLTPATSPERIKLYRNRATSYLDAFEYRNAIADLDRGIQQKSDLANNYRDRSTANLALGNYQAALEDATEAIQIKPSIESYHNRCYAQARLGDFAAANNDCQQAAKTAAKRSPKRLFEQLSQRNIRSRDAKLDLDSAQCYVKAGLGIKDAIELCDQAIEADPKQPQYYENKGLAHALLKQPDKAKTAFEKAAELFKQQGNETGVARVKQVLQSIN